MDEFAASLEQWGIESRADQRRRTPVKRGRVTLSRYDLYELLEVPEGIDIDAVEVRQDPLEVRLILSGDRLPVEPELVGGGESPEIDVLCIRDGNLCRVVWQDDTGKPIPLAAPTPEES